MSEFILLVVIYMNVQNSGMQMLPMGEFATKAECETYAVQVKKDLAEPGRTIRATCMPKAAMNKNGETKAPGKAK